MKMQIKNSQLPLIDPTSPLPLNDEQYFNMMVTDKNGYVDEKLLAIVLKYYPALSRFIATTPEVEFDPVEIVNQILAAEHTALQLTNQF